MRVYLNKCLENDFIKSFFTKTSMLSFDCSTTSSQSVQLNMQQITNVAYIRFCMKQIWHRYKSYELFDQYRSTKARNLYYTDFMIAHEQRILSSRVLIWLRHATCDKLRIKQNTNVKRRERRWNKLLNTFIFCLANSSANKSRRNVWIYTL